MTFSLTSNDAVYERKITRYIEFLYKINFSNGIYVDLSLSKPKTTYKIKIGKGNNSLLIKSLLSRRFWLEITTSPQDYSFLWTQGTDAELHQNQREIEGGESGVEQGSSSLSKGSRYMGNSD